MVTQIKDKDSPSQKVLGQRLYQKNVALSNNIRKSVLRKLPTDPNTWKEMRENFEAIVLGDPSFSLKNNIEDGLWKLHYKQIEEYRDRIGHAALLTKSDAPDVDDSAPAAHITKVHSQFKAFLLEASGFYHALIVKIRDKYGLPVSCFSEDPLHQRSAEKDAMKNAEMNKGLVSWHRCLICLGDLARYKILHEDESGTRDYALATGYYLQASSIWPSSGHPHHQLAIVASYSGDELMAVYWYFRSLAVESSISTTRESLVVLFEKNREKYLQLLDSRSSPTVKGSKLQARGKVEARRPSKDKAKTDANLLKRTGDTEDEMFKSFCIRFVRLNGIFFTRLSLETFTEVLAMVSGSFKMLLSHGPEEKLNFGKDEDENRLLIVRLVAILIFTVHNINNTTKDRSHMQRRVFLQNACTAVFQLMGMIFRRCTEIRDTCSSYLLPGILIFLEWLASCPDVASGINADESEANERLNFWSQYVKFLNKLLSSGILSVDAAENAFIQGANTFKEGETQLHLSLWEDFELRGYLPLLSAQKNIEYSRKHAFGEDRLKERKARIERVLAASKVLQAIVKVQEKEMCFDPEAKRFMIGTPIPLKNKSNTEGNKTEKDVSFKPLESLKSSDEEEDEVIVFKPNPLRLNAAVKPSSLPEGLAQNVCYVPIISDYHYQQDLSNQNGDLPVPVMNTARPVQSSASILSVEQQASTIDDTIYLGFLEDEPLDQSVLRGDDNAYPCSPSCLLNQQQSVHLTPTEISYMDGKLLNTFKSAMVGSGHPLTYSGKKVEHYLVDPLLGSLKMDPVSRPTRHHGPPPGFKIHPKKHVGETICSDDATDKNGMLYSDGLSKYQLPSATFAMGLDVSSQVGWRGESARGHHLHQEQQFSKSNRSLAPMLQLHQGESGLNDWYPF